MATSGRRIWIRIAIYIPIIALLILWQYVWPEIRGGDDVSPGDEVAPSEDRAEGGEGPSPSQPAPDQRTFADVPHRPISAAEQELGIAELGERRLAKLQVWQGLNHWRGARGELVWWHDGEQERVAYLPAPGEVPEQVGFQLFLALQEGRVVPYGDPEFFAQLADLSTSYRLPEGWTVLTPPGSGSAP